MHQEKDVHQAGFAQRTKGVLAPQRDAVARLQTERLSWLDELNRISLRENADRITQYVEDLDSARDRAAVVQEELNSRLSEQVNKRMYVLSVVASAFLGLGLITDMLGINVGVFPARPANGLLPLYVHV